MIVRLLLALFVLAISGRAVLAEAVDLEIVLAADGSGSIDEGEFRLQRKGYADAIANPQVFNAMISGRHRKTAVAYVEWASPTSVETIVDWMVISDEASAKAFAAAVLAGPRKVSGYNSISAAIVHSQRMIETNRYEGVRKIIDISGDGPQMNGPPLAAVRDAAVKAGITINALAIKTRGGHVPRAQGEALEEHYRRDVIGGDGAFVMVADEETPFAQVVLRKLVREVALFEPPRPIR